MHERLEYGLGLFGQNKIYPAVKDDLDTNSGPTLTGKVLITFLFTNGHVPSNSPLRYSDFKFVSKHE